MKKLMQSYLNNFFTNDEKSLFLADYNQQDDHSLSWNELEDEYKKISMNDSLQSFHMKISSHARDFSHYLFQKHVNEKTFVVYNLAHLSIKEDIDKIKNKYQILYDDVINFKIDKIISLYQNSGCNKIFIYLPQLIEQQMLLQSFCDKLKDVLQNNNINHIMVLDDVSTMFIVPKNYDCFDYVLFTCHALVPNFDRGILFYKYNIDCGGEDCAVAESYLNSLRMVLSKRDKILLFNQMLYQYFAEELQSDLFYIPNNTAPNIFYILYNNNAKISSNIIKKHQEKLANFGINCDIIGISIKCCYFMNQSVESMIEGLSQLKHILQKCIKLKERL